MFEQLLFQLVFAAKIAATMPQPFVHSSAPTLIGAERRPAPPVKNTSLVAPVLGAQSALAYDMASGTLLYQKNIHEKRSIASITKLMTAMVILDGHSLDDAYDFPRAATATEPVKVGFRPGENLKLETILKGLLINSGNDAALGLALIDSGSEPAFADKMNGKARALGLTNTHFVNASGLDHPKAYSTAEDVLAMALKSLTYDFIKNTVQTPRLEVYSTDGKTKHVLETTNELLKNSHFAVTGLKTGSTQSAGPSFVALAHKFPVTSENNSLGPNPEIITIVLDSPDRFQDSKILIDWVFRAYEWQ